MKVKIGNRIFDSEETPIMIILTKEDKDLISNMSPTASKFCRYPENTNPSEISTWMNEEKP